MVMLYLDKPKQKQKMSNPNHAPLNPTDYFDRIKHGPELKEVLSSRQLNPASVELASRAISLSMTTESGYRPPEADKFDIISRLGSYVQSRDTLDKLSARDSSFKERRPYMHKIIEFNHSVKAMIDNDPSRSLLEVKQFIVNTYTGLYRPHTKPELWPAKLAEFSKVIEETLVGMRSELAFAQIASLIDGITVDTEVTADEELRGVDAIVNMNGVDLEIDVKTSPVGVHKSDVNSTHRAQAVWPHVSQTDYANGGMRLSHKTALAKRDVVHNDLIQAYAKQYSAAA